MASEQQATTAIERLNLYLVRVKVLLEACLCFVLCVSGACVAVRVGRT